MPCTNFLCPLPASSVARRSLSPSRSRAGFLHLILILVSVSSTFVLGQSNLGLFRPDISPDGQQLVFEYQSLLWVVPASGGTARQLSPGPDRYHVPAWSPDGRRIAAIVTDPGETRFSLRVIEVESGIEKMVWEGQQPLTGTLEWNADGKSLVGSLGVEPNLTQFSVAGGEPSTTGIKGMHPRYSPDGSRLAFQTDANQDLWIRHVTTGETHRLATDIRVKSSFDWSPDGRQIVYESLDRESLDLWKVSADGGRAQPLTSDIAIEQGPRWHPNGQHIYFSHRRRIWRIRSDGNGMEPVQIELPVPASAPLPTLALENVSVLDLASGEWLAGRTLIIRESRIAAVQSSEQPLPEPIRRIDGGGGFAIPGLIDMHVHYEPWMGPFFLRYGVTRIVELGSGGGLDHILALGEEIRLGRSRGPLLFQSGMVMNGSGIAGPPGLGGIQSNDPEIIRQALSWHIEEGIDIVKIGSENTHETLRVILETAHANDLRVTGHIALVPLQEAIAMGQDGIEHPRGIGWGTIPANHTARPVPRSLSGMLRESSAWLDQDEKLVSGVIDQMVSAGVIWNPTLNIWVLLGDPQGEARDPEFQELPNWIQEKLRHERSSGFYGTWDEHDYRAFSAPLPKMRSMVGKFSRAGGVVTAGSDGGIPGLSLLQELDQLELAGLSPLESLRAATLNAARSLRKSADLGSLEAGKVADIVLLGGDPLQDLNELRQPKLVLQAGRLVWSEEDPE